MENEHLEITLHNRRKLMNEQWSIIGDNGRICDAMEHLADTSRLPSLINRQLSRLNREHDRLLKFFQQVRRDFPNLVEPPGIPPPEVKNEGNDDVKNEGNGASSPAAEPATPPQDTVENKPVSARFRTPPMPEDIYITLHPHLRPPRHHPSPRPGPTAARSDQ
jgi:hypothetical protein